VRLYDLATKHTTTLNDGSAVFSVAFSADGKTVASGDAAGQIVLYDRASGQTTTIDEGSGVESVAFSPDGKTLASGNDAGQVVLYNRASGHPTAISDWSNTSGTLVYMVAFSPDGRTLAAGNGLGHLVLLKAPLWTSSFAQLKSQLCRELGGLNMTRSQWASYVPDQPYRQTCP